MELAGAAERDDTLAAFCRAAHEMAAERDAPIPWNGDEGWQKTLNEMARTRFPRAREESAANGLVWERYLSEMWKDVMAGIWGPQWRKDLPPSPASRERVLRAAQTDGRADSPPGTEGAVALMRDRRDRQAARAGAESGAAPASGDAAEGASEPAANLVGSLGPPPGRDTTEVAEAERFELATARSSRAWEPNLGAVAMDTMSEMGAQGSETGSELAERVAGIAQALTENGHTSEEVGVAMKVEYAKAQFLDDWQRELRDGRTLLSVIDWAAAQLTTALPSRGVARRSRS